MKNTKIILISILLLFLVSRLYKISEIPVSLYWDEASIGYNAYSILQSGKDEWGQILPIHFKAFGEYKLPVYIYSTILPIKMFGLNVFSVRLPSVIFALLSVLLVYLIAKEISKNELAGLISAFFFSITPYFFIFSRTGFEAVPGLTFFLSAFYFFLKSWKNPLFFVFSGLFLVVSMYTYNGYRILSPLILFLFSLKLLYLYHFNLKKGLFIFLTIAVFILGSYPLIKFLQNEGSTNRFQAIGIENLNRKKVFIGLDIAKNYLAHFNPEFLFLNGDENLRSQQSGFGQLFIYDAILLFLGLLFLFKNPQINRWPLILLLLSFLPASVTREVPHALRSLSAAPFFSIISSLGVIYLQNKITTSKDKAVLVVVVVYLGLFLIYFNNFLNIYPQKSSSSWQEGYKLIDRNYTQQFNSYDNILISDRYNQPYIFSLFYSQYNPDQFRSQAVYNFDIRQSTSLVKSFDKFIFDDIDVNQLPGGRTLIFAHPTDRLNELWVKNILYHDDGTVAFYVYEYNR